MKDKVNIWIKTLIEFSVCFTICAIIALSYANVPKTEKIEGTYYLVSIQGTQELTKNNDYNNYLVLKGGTCTIHLSLSSPVGSSIHTYHYTGKTAESIKFEKNYIHIDYKKDVIITLKYNNGKHNILTYRRVS